jgi:hypothetical protein
VDSLKRFVTRHPRLTAWIVLAVGFVVILVVSARQVGFTAGQWGALIVTTIGLAGLCVWIIGWEEEEMGEEDGQGEPEPESEQV